MKIGSSLREHIRQGLTIVGVTALLLTLFIVGIDQLFGWPEALTVGYLQIGAK